MIRFYDEASGSDSHETNWQLVCVDWMHFGRLARSGRTDWVKITTKTAFSLT